jgi:hypothetical protein
VQARDITHLSALLIEIDNLTLSAKKCAEHTRFHSDNPVEMKRNHRTDPDVAVWLDRIESAMARLRTFRWTVEGLESRFEGARER